LRRLANPGSLHAAVARLRSRNLSEQEWQLIRPLLLPPVSPSTGRGCKRKEVIKAAQELSALYV
jgi:hypothetical protein